MVVITPEVLDDLLFLCLQDVYDLNYVPSWMKGHLKMIYSYEESNLKHGEGHTCYDEEYVIA